jgi:hypothetical protein
LRIGDVMPDNGKRSFGRRVRLPGQPFVARISSWSGVAPQIEHCQDAAKVAGDEGRRVEPEAGEHFAAEDPVIASAAVSILWMVSPVWAMSIVIATSLAGAIVIASTHARPRVESPREPTNGIAK